MSGLAHEQGFGGGLDRPQHLPAQVVDHATGYLAAFGALVALARRAREGGSYLVRVSLVHDNSIEEVAQFRLTLDEVAEKCRSDR